jgi:cell division transport system ATP-binding protein
VRLLARINATGTTVLMATHDNVIVDEFRRRVIELDNGKIVRDEAEGSYIPKEVVTPVPAPELDPDDLWSPPDESDWADEVVRGEG